MSEISKDSKISPLWQSLLETAYDSSQLTEPTTTMQPVTESIAVAEKSTDLGIRRANFIWPEDPVDELPVK